MNPKTGKEELLHIVYEQLGLRIDPRTPKEDLHKLLQYKVKTLPNTPINEMRNRLMTFIENNRSRLSLPCNGNCYEHHDGVVLYCHRQLLEENDND